MSDTTITVETSSEQEALKKGAAQLHAAIGDLVANATGEDCFLVSLIRRDAALKLQLSDDKMSATISAADLPIGNGQPFDQRFLESKLKEKGIQPEFVTVDADTLREKLEMGEEISELEIAHGVPPRDGKDAKVVLFINNGIEAGAIDSSGHVDYHERGFVETVPKDQRLATITPPTAGTPGRDVTGKPLAPKAGRDAVFSTDENVYRSEDGYQVFAAIDGMVRLVHNVLSITNVLELSGDVDIKTGNVHMDKGSVVVRGSVRAGFSVSAAANVLIQGTTTDAEIVADGDVVMNAGLIHGNAQAQGNITVRFAEDSVLEATGDITAQDNLIHCEALAGDNIYVIKGKGIIRGGRLRCGRTLEAKEIGSSSGHETRIEVGVPGKEELILIKERTHIIGELRKIKSFVGDIDDKNNIAMHLKNSSDDNEQIRALLEKAAKLQEAFTRVNALLRGHRESRKDGTLSRIKVHTTVHPGTTLVIHGEKYVVANPLNHCVFYYDENNKKVVAETF